MFFYLPLSTNWISEPSTEITPLVHPTCPRDPRPWTWKRSIGQLGSPKRSDTKVPGWWQLKYFLFWPLFEEMIQFDQYNIFQRGWNHQLGTVWWQPEIRLTHQPVRICGLIPWFTGVVIHRRWLFGISEPSTVLEAQLFFVGCEGEARLCFFLRLFFTDSTIGIHRFHHH